MKINDFALSVLKNFSAVNNSLIIDEGNVLRTTNATKTFWAKANLDVSFPKRVGIHDLKKFLSVASLLDDPEFEWGDKQVVMTSGDKTTKFALTDTGMLIEPMKTINVPSPEVRVSVTKKQIESVTRAQGVMQLPNIAFVGDGSSVRLTALNIKKLGSDTYDERIGETENTFRAVVDPTNFARIMPGDYEVEISFKGISKFSNDRLTYGLPVEESSTFLA